MRKFHLFNELFNIIDPRSESDYMVFALDNETMTILYEKFNLTHEDMKKYPGLEFIIKNHIVINIENGRARLMSTLIVEIDEKKRKLDNIQYDPSIIFPVKTDRGVRQIKYFPFFGLILSPEDEENLQRYAESIQMKVSPKIDNRLKEFILPEWRNVRYLYHGTGVPLFLYRTDLIPQTSFEARHQKNMFLPFAFFSVIPSRTFMCRGSLTNDNLPSLYRYRVKNTITNILDLDEKTPLCENGLCDSGSKKDRVCVVDPDCPSAGSMRKYATVSEIYGARNQDKLILKIYEEGLFNGYKWTGHEFETALVHASRFLEFDSVQFYISLVTGKPCSDRTSPLTAPVKDLELAYVIYLQYKETREVSKNNPFDLSHLRYFEKTFSEISKGASRKRSADITIYYPDLTKDPILGPVNSENPSIFYGYKKTVVNVTEDFFDGFLLGVGLYGYDMFQNLQIFQVTNDPDIFVRILILAGIEEQLRKWKKNGNTLSKNESEEYEEGLKFFAKLYEKDLSAL